MTLSNDDLSEPERRLWQAASKGTLVDLQPAEPNLDPAQGATWNADCMVRAELLAELLTGALTPPETPRARAVRLRGARITGTLDLEAATLICPLRLDDCYFEEAVKLREAQAPMVVRLSGCHVPSLDADQLETRNNLVLNEGSTNGFTAGGGVTLAGARIGGQLVLDGAQLSNPSGSALDADGLRTEEGMFCRDGFTARGEVRLVGASIGGDLDFTGASLTRPDTEDGRARSDKQDARALDADQLTVEGSLVCADGFRALGQVCLAGAHIGGQLILDGARLDSEDGWALNAANLTVKKDMICGVSPDEQFHAQGGVSLAGARIGGTLSFSHANLTKGQQESLRADRLTIEGDMRCGAAFTANGTISLVGARIGGELSITKTTLDDRGGIALLADGITVERDMQCGKEFTARGEVDLVSARIGGWLSFTDATLDNPRGQALRADGITVERGVQCGERFTARGGVRLPRAQIGEQLIFKEASLSEGAIVESRYEDSRYERTLQLQDLRVPVLSLEFGQPPGGTVDLVGARVGVFVDEQKSWAATMRLLGFTYDTIESKKKIGVKARLGWLTRDQDGYSPQLYEQLAAVYRRTGHEDEARRVAIEKQRRRRSTLKPQGRAWNWLLYLTVGYGYRTWQAAVWLLGLLLVGTWVFDRAYPVSMVPAKQPVPPFHALVYTLDVLLPIVDLGQQSAWQPRGAALRWLWVLIGAGWVLTTAVVAGLTGILKRD
jgi:hypothetical protein